jgi:hypothetical protein
MKIQTIISNNATIAITTSLIGLLSIGGYCFWKLWIQKQKYMITTEEINHKFNDSNDSYLNIKSEPPAPKFPCNPWSCSTLKPDINRKQFDSDMSKSKNTIEQHKPFDASEPSKAQQVSIAQWLIQHTKLNERVKFALETDSTDSDKSNDNIPLVISDEIDSNNTISND